MAGTRGHTRIPVVEALEEEEYTFDFYQAVRLLEAMRPEAVPVGEGPDPSSEAVRFRSELSLAFPASEIIEVIPHEGEPTPAEVLVSFLGVAGAQGPLPRPFTEDILERVASHDTAARDFLDIFNHRLISLLYRAREKHRVGQRVQSPERSATAEMAFSLMGMGGKKLRGRMGIADRSLLYYSGLLSQGVRSAVGLEGILSDFFRVLLRPVDDGPPGQIRVREFVGRWHALEETERTALGVTNGNCRLGTEAVLGSRVWDQQGMTEIVVGPLDFPRFERFLPGGDALPALKELMTLYLRGDALFVVRLLLRARDVPKTVLSGGSVGARLGLTSWLRTKPFDQDADDVVLC
jgi:type VI secretion system protein ImpH